MFIKTKCNLEKEDAKKYVQSKRSINQNSVSDVILVSPFSIPRNIKPRSPKLTRMILKNQKAKKRQEKKKILYANQSSDFHYKS